MSSAKIAPKPPKCAASSVGSQIALPKITTVAPVTATLMNDTKAIGPGNPMLWPSTWSFWLLAKRVKSQMFSDSVAQKPTIAVRLAATVGQNRASLPLPGAKAEGASSIGPKPFA